MVIKGSFRLKKRDAKRKTYRFCISILQLLKNKKQGFKV